MLRIVEAHGFDKLQYWGVSYGSVLGSVFASIFPERVGRVIIDAIVDMEQYFAGVWESNLMDTDAGWAQFASDCHKAGQTRCALFSSTSQEIVERVDNITKQVTLRPVPVKTDTQYGIVDYDKIRKVIFTSLYDPYETFSKLAQGLADLEQGDGAKILEMAEERRFECPSCSAPKAPPPQWSDAATIIDCNDAQVPSNDTYEYAEEHLERLLKTSQFGDMWAGIALSCNGWPKYPKSFGGPVGGNTSFPLLIIGNTADPVTPLWAAKKVARSFPNSVVLTQDSPGHTALAAVSACTFKYVGEYFRNGTLPDANTICEVDIDLFPSEPTDSNYEYESQAVLGDEEAMVRRVQSLMKERRKTRSYQHSLPLSPMY